MTTKFQSINRTAQQTGISTSTLRRWLAEGRLPGFYSGSWYYCNLEELEAMIAFANRAAAITTSRHGAIPAMPTLREME